MVKPSTNQHIESYVERANALEIAPFMPSYARRVARSITSPTTTPSFEC